MGGLFWSRGPLVRGGFPTDVCSGFLSDPTTGVSTLHIRVTIQCDPFVQSRKSSPCSLQNWERTIHAPTAPLIPRIVAWLGHEPKDTTAHDCREQQHLTCPTLGLREY